MYSPPLLCRWNNISGERKRSSISWYDVEGLPCDAVDLLFRTFPSLLFDWVLRRQTTMTIATTEMTRDDADDRMTINRRCDVSSDLSLMELSSFCLSDVSSISVVGWVLYTSVGTCTSNPLSVVPMKFAYVLFMHPSDTSHSFFVHLHTFIHLWPYDG